jgi:hypothetical protein
MSCARIGIIMYYAFDMTLNVKILAILQGAVLNSSILVPSFPLFTHLRHHHNRAHFNTGLKENTLSFKILSDNYLVIALYNFFITCINVRIIFDMY